MSRLYDTSMEQRSNTAGHEWDSITGSARITYDTGTFYDGTVSMKVVGSSSASTYVERVVRSSNGNLYFMFRVRFSGFPTDATGAIFQALTTNLATVTSSIGIRTDGKLELFDGSIAGTSRGTSSALSTGQWYRVELALINGGSPEMELRIYNDSNAQVGSSVTGAMAATGTGGFDLGMPDFVTNFTAFFDSLIVNDDQTSDQNSWVGNQRLAHLDPNASGDANAFATQTGGTAGASNNYTRVNETTADDATSFNGSSTLNQEDLFKLPASGIASGDTIRCVSVHARFRNSTADATAVLKLEIEKASGGTIAQSSAITPNSTTWRTNVAGTTTPKNSPLIRYTNPDGGSWSSTDFDGSHAQIGYKLTTGPGTAGRRIDVSKLWAIVSYTPATDVTTTQTTTGKARIEKAVSQTTTGKARIEKAATQTTTGKARIQKAVNQTITGLARITATTLKTITGLARIQKSATQTMTGKSRIERTSGTILDQSSNANTTGTGFGTTTSQKLAQSFTPSITGPLVQATFSIAPGDGSPSDDIRCQIYTNNSGVPGTLITTSINTFASGGTFNFSGFVATASTKYWFVLSRTGALDDDNDFIAGGNSEFSDAYSGGDALYYDGGSWLAIDNTPGIYNDLYFLEYYQPTVIYGKSNIALAVNQTITGLSRITATTLQTITGKARVTNTSSQTTTGKSRIEKSASQTIQGLSRITKSVLQTITGVSRITATTTKTQQGVARIEKTVTQTQQGVSRIQKSVQQTQTGVARVQKSVSQTTTGKARVEKTVTQTTTGKSRITNTTQATQTGKGRIQITSQATITGTAKIALNIVSTQQTIMGKAFILKAPWYRANPITWNSPLSDDWFTDNSSAWETKTVGDWFTKLTMTWQRSSSIDN